MTDNEIKEKLSWLWAKEIKIYGIGTLTEYYDALQKKINFKTISEIKALMLADGVDSKEINKIMEGE